MKLEVGPEDVFDHVHKPKELRDKLPDFLHDFSCPVCRKRVDRWLQKQEGEFCGRSKGRCGKRLQFVSLEHHARIVEDATRFKQLLDEVFRHCDRYAIAVQHLDAADAACPEDQPPGAWDEERNEVVTAWGVQKDTFLDEARFLLARSFSENAIPASVRADCAARGR